MTIENVLKEMAKELGDFIEYARKHGVDIQAVKSDNPDTFKKIFGEPCEDVISREKTMQIVRKWFDRNAVPSELKNEIEQLPPVTPQQRTGHWIYDRTRDWDGECKYECSECGMGSDVDYAYCMRCGAKMEEVIE